MKNRETGYCQEKEARMNIRISQSGQLVIPTFLRMKYRGETVGMVERENTLSL
jgi:hypothetical protein